MSKKHEGHGGSWKVAYADFVTAMMALFLVLWLTAQDTRIKEAVERAFRNPFASVTKESVGIIPNDKAQALASSSGNYDSASAIELNMLRRLNQDLLQSLQENESESNTIKLDPTPEGLRLTVFDRSHRPVFQPDSVEFTDYGNWVFSTLAWVVSHYTNCVIELEGHTELGHIPARPDFDNWELSAGRANAARRRLIKHGVQAVQIAKVAGFADTVPMPDTPPADEANRRVTVMLKLRASTS
jgi:chemotaxis protein MotB